jgi:hypothetical protein
MAAAGVHRIRSADLGHFQLIFSRQATTTTHFLGTDLTWCSSLVAQNLQNSFCSLDRVPVRIDRVQNKLG